MVECYFYFYEQISALLNEEQPGLEVREKVIRLFEALRNSLQVVTIEIDDRDDPQVIFETLNARGQPLLPSDLLRNYIFLRAAQKNESQEELYNTYWLAFDEPFWRAEEKQGRLNRPRADIFLQHYLSLKRREEISIGHLYAEYKYWIATARPFPTVREELAEMERHRGFFRKLVEPEQNTPLGRFAHALYVFDIRTVYPLVLAILERDLPSEVLAEILTDLESYIIRRAVCNLTTKNYNRQFLALLNRLPASDLTRTKFREVLLVQQGESSIWPRDEEFQQAWLDKPAFETLGVARIQWILRQLADHSTNNAIQTTERPSPLYVEHIMPQDWIPVWPLPSGKPGIRWFERSIEGEHKEQIEASNLRDRLKHSFGNLTLIKQPLNSAIANSDFSGKKAGLLANLTFPPDEELRNLSTWSEDEIKRRGSRLFGIARRVWPHGQ
jgi:hypothetical protein